jgi:NAD(P)-dependent dehydrogenase (short-subunit alcohol dehydrogenase family)
MRLADKVAVVTGGASGLGRRAAELLVQDKGARVAVFDVNEDGGVEVVRKLGSERAIFCRVDVRDEPEVAAGVARAVDAFGAVHVCVNAAGVVGTMRILDRDGCPRNGASFRDTVMVHLVGTFHVMSHCAAQMARNAADNGEERGVIVNIASIAAFEGNVGGAAYAAAKAGVVGLALPAARELSTIGVRVNTIAPGLFMTQMAGQVSDKVRAAMHEMIEFPKRPGDLSEFASLVAYLCENAYINGECIRIDAATRLRAR